MGALNAQYPGAKVTDASFSDDDGPEFDLSIQFHARQIEVSFNPLGQITGIEEVISRRDLPRTQRPAGFVAIGECE